MDRLTTEGGSACPVCGGPTRPRIDVGDFALHRCGACRSWSSDARQRGAHTSFEPEAYFANADLDREKWEALFAKLGERRIEAALDVGCGTGAFLAWLTGRLPEAQVEGIEIDPGRAAQARAANPGATVHRGDALEVASRLAGRFDLITLWDVFEHVVAPTRLLEALAARLAPGGLLYVQTIHEYSLVPTLGRLSYTLSGGRLRLPARRTHEAHHLVFFSRAGLDHAASRAGLVLRARWYDRLAHGRMDGAPLLTALTSAALRVENALGNGLFVNLLLERPDAAGIDRPLLERPERGDEQVLADEAPGDDVEGA